MTKITFYNNEIIVKGHSGYGTEGNDIVCSAISSMITTSVRAILKYSDKAIEVDEGNALVVVKTIEKSPFLTLIIDNLKELLKELEEQYPKYVKVEVI